MDEVFELQTTEQMRAISDELRQRIVEAMLDRPLTATQVGERLGIPATRAHYHVRELERVGLVRLVETREKGGILEKYFQPVAATFVIPPSLVRSDRGGALAAVADFVQDTTRRLLAALSRADRGETGQGVFAVLRTHAWATDEEMRDILKQQDALFAAYEQRRGVEGEKEHTVVHIVFPTLLGESTSEHGAPEQAAWRRVTVAGVVSYEREDLERVHAAGQQLDINVAGRCVFAPDVPADLVDATVAEFNLHGQLSASDEVRAVLERKKG